MLSRTRSIQVAALCVCLLGLPALLAVPGTFGPLSFAAVATVLVVLAAIAMRPHAQAHEARSLAQLVSETDAGIPGRRNVRVRP